MTNEALAGYSNLAVYSALVVLGIAFLAFAIDLAGTRSRALAGRSGASGEGRMSAASGGTDTLVRGDAPAVVQADEGPSRRQAAGIGIALSRLASLLLVAAVVMRALSVSRAPWGNLYEYLLTAAAAVSVVYVVMSLRRDVRWLGVFLTALLMLILGPALTVYT